MTSASKSGMGNCNGEQWDKTFNSHPQNSMPSINKSTSHTRHGTAHRLYCTAAAVVGQRHLRKCPLTTPFCMTVRQDRHRSCQQGLPPCFQQEDVCRMTGSTSLYMTDESVAAGAVPDYKVVVVPIRRSEGYTLNRLKVMITSVYPSSQATREQIEGRINRIGQKGFPNAQGKPCVRICTVHAGLLTVILKNHRHATSLQEVMRTLAKDISL